MFMTNVLVPKEQFLYVITICSWLLQGLILWHLYTHSTKAESKKPFPTSNPLWHNDYKIHILMVSFVTISLSLLNGSSLVPIKFILHYNARYHHSPQKNFIMFF